MVPLMPQVWGIAASMPSRNQPLMGNTDSRRNLPPSPPPAGAARVSPCLPLMSPGQAAPPSFEVHQIGLMGRCIHQTRTQRGWGRQAPTQGRGGPREVTRHGQRPWCPPSPGMPGAPMPVVAPFVPGELEQTHWVNPKFE